MLKPAVPGPPLKFLTKAQREALRKELDQKEARQKLEAQKQAELSRKELELSRKRREAELKENSNFHRKTHPNQLDAAAESNSKRKKGSPPKQAEKTVESVSLTPTEKQKLEEELEL